MYLSFSWHSGRNFVVQNSSVERIVEAGDLYRIPRSKPFVLGVTEYGGMLIAVFELRQLFPPEFTGNLSSMPHLILFRGEESLNAFPAEALETIQSDFELRHAEKAAPFLTGLELLHAGISYLELDLGAIEQHWNIP